MPRVRGRTSRQSTVEEMDCVSITLAFLRKAGLVPGSKMDAVFEDPRYVSATIQVVTRTPDQVRLRFTHMSRPRPPSPSSRRWTPQDYMVDVVATPIPNGGVQWWFICPVTKRRARILYLPAEAERFLSRQAHGLIYQSQLAKPLQAAVAEIQRIQHLLRNRRHWTHIPTKRPDGMDAQSFSAHVARLKALLEKVRRSNTPR